MLIYQFEISGQFDNRYYLSLSVKNSAGLAMIDKRSILAYLYNENISMLQFFELACF